MPNNIDVKSRLLAVPESPNQQVAQAAAAIEAAWRDGIAMQTVELLLPLIGATDLDDWPGGIRQQYKAASPLVSSIVQSLKRVQGLTGTVASEVWDDGDAVGSWVGPNLGVVLFPTADVMEKPGTACSRGASTASFFADTVNAARKAHTRPEHCIKLERPQSCAGPRVLGLQPLRALAGRPSASLTIIINPQWSLSGALINDFGFGLGRRDKEQFVAGFQPSYALKTQRIYGDSIRIFKAHPGPWQINLIDKRGKSELLGTSDTQPTYKEVEAALKARPSSAMNKSWVTRLQDEFKWNQDSLQNK
ncbi:MAG: hypothetical protein WDW36_000504 [Sanguina aurantia]